VDFYLRSPSALQDHTSVRAHVVERHVRAATVITYAAKGVCERMHVSRLSHRVKFMSNPNTDDSIRSLMGGARGGGRRVTFAPFVTDKEQFLSVAQVRPALLYADGVKPLLALLQPPMLRI
jgi:hypothetical protein